MFRWLLLLVALAAPARAGEAAFTFVDREGRPVEVRREAEPERALLLHFWATWCPECPSDLARLAAASAGCERVRVVAVDAGDGAAEVDKFLARHALNLSVLRDPKGEAWRQLDGRGIPMNAWWTAAGHDTDVGPKSAAQWTALLASLGCRPAP
jgi:peroxiredoxin